MIDVYKCLNGLKTRCQVALLLKKPNMYLLVVMIKNILNYANQEKQEFFYHFKITFAVKLYGVINP